MMEVNFYLKATRVVYLGCNPVNRTVVFHGLSFSKFSAMKFMIKEICRKRTQKCFDFFINLKNILKSVKNTSLIQEYKIFSVVAIFRFFRPVTNINY